MNKYSTVLTQLLRIIPRKDFQKAVERNKTEFASKGFSSWAHLSSMIFSQLSGQKGLRGLEFGINAQRELHSHLEIERPIKRSTISYANKNRTFKLFEDTYFSLLHKVSSLNIDHKHRFKNPLFSIDATTIDLCLKLFPWADFRKGKAGIKLSVTLDHKGYVPCFVTMYNAQEHEVTKVDVEKFNEGDIIAFDRGYNDYKLFHSMNEKKIIFVTRQKSNAKYHVCKKNCENISKGILSDEIISFTGKEASKNCPEQLRRIVSRDKVTGKKIVILTNQLVWAGSTIAAVYRDRWHIELFFKAMKQNLMIKSFLGTSQNAVLIQIWTALIAYLLFSYIKYKSKANICFRNFMTVLPTILFQRRNLWEILFGNIGSPTPKPKPVNQFSFGF
jgi:hypothetical protein